MTAKKRKAERRGVALSRDRIVDAAIAILDRDGESGLTFKALAGKLTTGPGAIYNHIADKDDVMTAACDAIVAQVQDARLAGAPPQEAIRAFALGLYHAFDRHPWVGAVLTRAPERMPMLRILEGFGQEVAALCVPEAQRWRATMALFNYVVGVGGHNAANAQMARARNLDRTETLTSMAKTCAALDPVAYPFVRTVAAQLPGHDDRDDFVAGVDYVIAGILAVEGSFRPSHFGSGHGF